MIDDIIKLLDPSPYINNTWNFFFPNGAEDDIVLTKGEKSSIVKQIVDVKEHLGYAKRLVEDERFDEAIDEVEKAISASTCSRCQKKMIVSGLDMDHAGNVCPLDEDKCEMLTDKIIADIDDFTENYLPRVEDVLNAREV